MTKRFIYEVGDEIFGDDVAFGQAWKDAKAYAQEHHLPIYRTIIEKRYDKYCEGGMFVSVDSDAPVKIF